MVELGLLALMAALSVGTFFLPHGDSGSSDTDDDLAVDETETEETAAETAETGAVFNVTEDGVDIQVGEDETRSLAVIYFKDSQDDPDNWFLSDEARFYLVPEDVDWSGVNWETQHQMPGEYETDESIVYYTLKTFEEHFGLELIATVDLLGVSDDVETPAERIGEVTSNVPISGYYLEAVTDGDYLASFLPEDYVEIRNGLAQETVTTDTVGTDDPEWFFSEEDGISVDGAGGADILETTGETVSIIGGAGDDSIDADGLDNFIQSGDGDDVIYAAGGELHLGKGDDKAAITELNPTSNFTIGDTTVHGGAGNDTISSGGGDSMSTIYGEAGDDNLGLNGEGAVGRGGNGADFLHVSNGATGYGGAGDDRIHVWYSGARAFGGGGDDLFRITNDLHNDDDPTVFTLGEGNDTVEVITDDAYRGEADDIFLRITDFDPDEDVLQVAADYAGRVAAIEIVEADDGSHTDVRVTYKEKGLPPGIGVIRLDGTPGLTADQIIVEK